MSASHEQAGGRRRTAVAWAGRAALVLALAGALLGCSSERDGSVSSTTAPPPSGATEAEPLVVYVEPGESRTDGVDHLLAERSLGASPSEVPTPDAKFIFDPDVSGDGTFVVYAASSDQAGSGQIWVTSLGRPGGEPRLITEGSADWRCPRWMPDDRHVLAFSGDPEPRLVVVDVASGDAEVISTGIPGDEMSLCADVSPDGRELAVARDTAGFERNEVWAIAIEGGGERLVGTIPERCLINHVAWSPSGEVIAADAICERNDRNGIWLVPTAGGPPTQLVGENRVGGPLVGSLQYWEPAWDPSGDRVFFHRNQTSRPGETPGAPSVWEVATAGGEPEQVGAPSSTSPAAGPG